MSRGLGYYWRCLQREAMQDLSFADDSFQVTMILCMSIPWLLGLVRCACSCWDHQRGWCWPILYGDVAVALSWMCSYRSCVCTLPDRYSFTISDGGEYRDFV